MYVCMYVCMHVCMYILMYVCVCVCLFIGMCDVSRVPFMCQALHQYEKGASKLGHACYLFVFCLCVKVLCFFTYVSFESLVCS